MKIRVKEGGVKISVKISHIFEVVNLVSEILDYGGPIQWDETRLSGQFRKPSSNQKLIELGWETKMYTDFKLEHGYTPAEIIAKLRSLKGVLEPNLTNDNINLLKKAGFKEIETIFNYVPFEGIMAIK